MSVVAWDGKTLATDRRICSGDIIHEMSKSRMLPNGEVVAWTGCVDTGLLMVQWYEDGADPERFPRRQKTSDFANLIVATTNGIREYGQGAIPIVMDDSFCAWGSGSAIALGALAMGATAEEAARIACRYSSSCGNGIDIYKIRP